MSDQETNVKILSHIAFEKLKTQIASIDGLDNKVGVMFGLTNGLLIGLLGYVGFLEKPISNVILHLFYISVVAYLLNTFVLVLSYRIRRWDFRPNLVALKKICSEVAYKGFPETIEAWVAAECMSAYDYNDVRIVQKRRLTFWALVFILLQTVLLIVIATLVVIN